MPSKLLSLLTLSSFLLSLSQATPLQPRQTSTPRWETLPPTPALPSPISNQTFSHEGVKLWYQSYNTAAGGTPIVFIHGGLGYSAYFGDVIRILAENRFVVAVDRRGHGRSTYNANDVFTYDMFASDTYALLRNEGIEKAIWVGWSDGAATLLAALMNSTINATIEKGFVFAGFQHVSDSNTTFSETAIYTEFVTRCATEYAELQPSANFTDFGTKVATLETTLPEWSDAELGVIDGSKVTIAGADHDEAVNLDVPAHLHSVIQGSGFVMLRNVSHFAPVQDPVGFAAAVEEFVSS